MVAFDPLRTVTSAGAWEARDEWQTVDTLTDGDLDGTGEIVVFSAHPDDETIALGGFLAAAAARGLTVRVIVATGDDERRADELRRALAALGVETSPRFLGLTDGALKHEAEQLREEIERVLVRAGGASGVGRLVLAPWPGDRHGDHRTLGRELAEATRATGDTVLFFPVWLWQWGEPADMPWDRLVDVPSVDSHRQRKTAALAAFASQHWSEDNRDGVLTSEFVARAREGREVLIRPQGTAAGDLADHFESLHRRSDDPWSVRSRWYERRKRAVTVACLPGERYERILELGASIGELTAELADRADAVLAVDGSAAAVETARTRLAGRRQVTVSRMRVPEHWPAGRFDLIVVSELAYYLADDEWRLLIARCVGSLAEGGAVLLCHWLGSADDFAQSGEQAHTTFRSASGLAPIVTHRDAEFLLEVFA